MAEIDMTKPQPCTKFRDAGTVEWIAKLSEETNEVIQEAKKFMRLKKRMRMALNMLAALEIRKYPSPKNSRTLSQSAPHGLMRSAMTNICAARCKSV